MCVSAWACARQRFLFVLNTFVEGYFYVEKGNLYTTVGKFANEGWTGVCQINFCLGQHTFSTDAEQNPHHLLQLRQFDRKLRHLFMANVFSYSGV